MGIHRAWPCWFHGRSAPRRERDFIAFYALKGSMSLPTRSLPAAGATARNDLGGRQHARLQQVGGEVAPAAEVLARYRCFPHPSLALHVRPPDVAVVFPPFTPALA